MSCSMMLYVHRNSLLGMGGGGGGGEGGGGQTETPGDGGKRETIFI